MKSIRIDTDRNTYIFREDKNGKVVISINGAAYRFGPPDLSLVTIDCLDSGIPGVIGPNIVFTVDEVVQKINEEAKVLANNTWDGGRRPL